MKDKKYKKWKKKFEEDLEIYKNSKYVNQETLEFIEKSNEFAKTLNTKEKARKFLISTRIYNEDGSLAERYR